MGYLAVAPGTVEARLAAATSRWERLAAERPELVPAITLQRKLVGRLLDLTDQVEHGPLPRLTLPPRYLGAKLARGVPALAGEPIPLPIATLQPAFLGLCDVLGQGGAGAAAEQISAAVTELRIDVRLLLTASLMRDQTTIRAIAERLSLAPDLVWLTAELTTSPFVHILQRTLLGPPGPEAVVAGGLAAWRWGYCPACGSWPALAEQVASRRLLRCSFCALGWDAHDRCPYCGGAVAGGATTSDAAAWPRAELCEGCRGYVKVVASDAPLPFPLVTVADLETAHLDFTAAQRGYSRPALRTFTAAR
jgi:hypothetical protein